MQRIAVITAANPGFKNPGMTSVDLAFEGVARRLGIAVETRWYSLVPPDPSRLRPHMAPPLAQPLRPLAPALGEVLDHDAILMWGDFLQARHYLRQETSSRLMRAGAAADRVEAAALAYRCLLLRDAPDEAIARTFLFGGSVLHNTEEDGLDPAYRSAFERLVRGARGVWMRDPISAAKVTQIRGGDASHLGVDPALLLRDEALRVLPRSAWSEDIEEEGPEGRMGVFVGSRMPIPAGLPALCRGLARRLDVAPEWLPWLVQRDRSWRSPRRRLSRPGSPLLGDLFEAIRRYRLVVSDTYHLCVNAWRAGTPAVCLGLPQPERREERLTLNDLKKHVFCMTYDAADFYVTPADLQPRRLAQTVERLAGLIRAGAAESIAARIRAHRDRVEARLLRALRDAAPLAARSPRPSGELASPTGFEPVLPP